MGVYEDEDEDEGNKYYGSGYLTAKAHPFLTCSSASFRRPRDDSLKTQKTTFRLLNPTRIPVFPCCYLLENYRQSSNDYFPIVKAVHCYPW